MAQISTAVPIDRRSRVVGYKLQAGTFTNDTSNLPQKIALFGEANTANQMGLSTVKRQVTSAQEVGELYGFGSPLYMMARILFPKNSDGIGGIPVYVFPQVTDVDATASTRVWTVTGTATANATHYIIVNGRDGVDFQTYSFNVVIGDTAAIIAGKMKDAVNGVLGSPVLGTNLAGVATFTTKWKGATSAEINVIIDMGGNSAGLSYTQSSTTAGTGAVDLADSLSQFGDDWFTIAINPYIAHLGTFEAFNGFPEKSNPTGRFAGIIFKPLLALFGSVKSTNDDLIAITDVPARKSQCTNALCPAPNSPGFTFEAAANMALLHAFVANNTPHLDVNNLRYADMPVPSDGNIGSMADYTNRDYLVKRGCSTVKFVDGRYVVQDFVTTYHPDSEIPLQYAYARNLQLDFNVAYRYKQLEERFLIDKAIVRNGQVTDVANVVTPNDWRAICFDLFDDLGTLALINEPQFSKDSLRVQISETNPDRFETFFRYSRTGIARITSTDAEAGFNF